MHARLHPRQHRFVYRLFLLALDLDELPDLHRNLRLFSVDRPNLFSLSPRDFLPLAEPTFNPTPSPGPQAPAAPVALKDRVLAFARRHGSVISPDTRVLLVTLPRMLGYRFNPVSFYFLTSPEGEPRGAICEVTNTFHEIKPYWLSGDTLTADGFRLRRPKHFYVSPFTDVDAAFDFHLRPPNDRLAVQIDDYTGEQRTLTSTLTGPARPLTDAALAWFLFKYPFLTLRVITLIHWHALRLWLKRVPWFAKAARPADQRDLYRPHPSLTRDGAAPDSRG